MTGVAFVVVVNVAVAAWYSLDIVTYCPRGKEIISYSLEENDAIYAHTQSFAGICAMPLLVNLEMLFLIFVQGCQPNPGYRQHWTSRV